MNAYLDYAAATPVDTSVTAVMEPYAAEKFQNPSSLYQSARAVKRELESARSKLADLLGAKKSEIIFTAGGTESVNLAILGAARSYPGCSLVSTTIEHDAVLACLEQAKKEGHQTTLVPVDANGVVDPAALVAAIDDETLLVSVLYANNEIGTIQPIAKIAQQIQAIRSDRRDRNVDRPLYLHTDAAQAAGWLDLHVSRLGVDLLTLNGAKMYGPKQSGCLYVRTGTQLTPIIFGGGQERGLRGGTESVAMAAGLAAACDLMISGRDDTAKRVGELRDRLWQAIQTELPDAQLNGDTIRRLPTHLNFCLPGIDGEDAVAYLDKAGIQVSTGSACSTGDGDPSHVLLALGLTAEEARASLRVTLGRTTTPSEIDYAASTIPTVLQHLRMLE